MYGWGEVISFEAQERIFYILAGNIALNNCFNARAIWAAVGAKSGQIKVPVPDYFIPSSFGSLEIRKTDKTEFIGQQIDYSDAKTQLTKMKSIDELNLSRIDFIKIDIEGMEMDALFGAKNSISKMKPQLLIEKIKSDVSEIEKFVNNLGYKTFPLGLNLLAVHETDPVLSDIKIT
jgi:FkbM family methyltransferase